ncbi:hypothetical protein LSTR_LSTR003960 [Laodelphax striatellus]|uniref:Uncharacterized protein n=1 Tax=Laodelphax striatellus TaxID=195883 RepID=A0A482X2G6_LAOST|nr:hypothetical protein LSTR_LSTR003960 [Laodelphax striatellus]
MTTTHCRGTRTLRLNGLTVTATLGPPRKSLTLNNRAISRHLSDEEVPAYQKQVLLPPLKRQLRELKEKDFNRKSLKLVGVGVSPPKLFKLKLPLFITTAFNKFKLRQQLPTSTTSLVSSLPAPHHLRQFFESGQLAMNLYPNGTEGNGKMIGRYVVSRNFAIPPVFLAFRTRIRLSEIWEQVAMAAAALCPPNYRIATVLFFQTELQSSLTSKLPSDIICERIQVFQMLPAGMKGNKERSFVADLKAVDWMLSSSIELSLALNTHTKF